MCVRACAVGYFRWFDHLIPTKASCCLVTIPDRKPIHPLSHWDWLHQLLQSASALSGLKNMNRMRSSVQYCCTVASRACNSLKRYDFVFLILVYFSLARNYMRHCRKRGKKVSVISANKICFFYSALAFCLQSIYNMDTHDRTSEDFFFLPKFKMKVK